MLQVPLVFFPRSCRCSVDGENRARSLLHYAFCDAAEQQVLQTRKPVGTNHDQINFSASRFLDDHGARIAFAEGCIASDASRPERFAESCEGSLGVAADAGPEVWRQVSALDLLEFHGQVVGVEQGQRRAVFSTQVCGPVE